MTNLLLKSGFCLSLIVLCNSCQVNTPHYDLNKEAMLAESFSTTKSGIPKDKWWQDFANEELTKLLDKAMKNNFSIKTAWRKLQQSYAILEQTESRQRPTLDLSTGASYNYGTTPISSSATSSEQYTASLAAGYEVDLWGKLKYATEVSQLNLLNAQEGIHTAAMSITARLVESWINLQAIEQKLLILNNQINLRKEHLELLLFRYKNGRTNRLTILQQERNLANIKTQKPLLVQQKLLLQHIIAILVGDHANNLQKITVMPLPNLQPLPTTGIPANLLENRPDIRSVANSVEASILHFKIKKLDKRPTLRLSSLLNLSSANFNELFEQWLLKTAANLSVSLYDGNRRNAIIREQEAIIQQLVITYKSVVQGAVKEVEDALSKELTMQENLKLSDSELTITKQSLVEAQARYNNGIGNYLSVITAQQQVQSLEMGIVDKKARLLVNRISLHRALGGKWIETVYKKTIDDSSSQL